MSHPCVDAVIKAMSVEGKDGKKELAISKREVEAIVNELDNVRSKIFNRGMDLAGPEFQKAAVDFIKNMRYQAAAARRQASENLLKREKLFSFIDQPAFKEDPVAAIKAILAAGEKRLSEGGNFSVESTKNGLRAKHMGQLFMGLKEQGLDKLMERGLMDKEVMAELFEFRKGGKPGISGNPQALEAAKIIKGVQDSVLKTLQAAGSAVREMNGYIMKQSHDALKIGEAGFDQWSQDIAPLLDEQKTFGALPKGQWREALKGIYDDIQTGQWGSNIETGVSDQFMTVYGMSPNLSTKTSRARALHFEDAQGFYDYNQKYGSKNLLESVLSSIDSSSRDAALMNKLGTNPEGALAALKARAKVLHAGNEKALNDLKANDASIGRYFDSVRGLSSVPGTSMAARAAQNARAFESITKLGSSFMSSFGDLAVAGSVIKGVNNKNLLSNVSDLVGEYLSAATNKGGREKWAARLGVALDDMSGEMYSRFGAQDAAPGVMSKLARLSNRINFMSTHVDSAKIAMAKQIAMDLAENAGSSFENLPPRISSTLARYGIDAKDWSMMGRAVEDVGGVQAMTPEALRALPEDLFPGGKQGRFQTEAKYLSLLNEQANIASTTTGVRERAWMGKDEGLGIIARMIGQFKGVAMMSLNTGGRILMDNPATRPTSLLEAASGKGDMMGFAGYLTLATALGYAGLVVKEAAQGKTPPDPFSPKTFTESALKGGALGLYGDFLFGEFHKGVGRGAAEAMLGPVLGQGADVLDLWAKTRAGEAKAKDWLQPVFNNMPNLFYTKGAIDYLFLNQVHEALNPGYQRRLEQRTREAGQNYFAFNPTGR